MRKIALTSITFFILLLITQSPFAFGKGKDEAPGQQKKEAKANSAQKEALIGNVAEVTDKAVIVEEKKGKKITEVTLDAKTEIIGQNTKKQKKSYIKPNDIIATERKRGESATDEGKLKKPIKLFVKKASESAQLKRRAVHGLITNIAGSVITLVHPVHRERTYVVVVTQNTVITLKGVAAATIANLAPGLRIAAVGDLGEDGSLVAKRIHVIPGKAKGIFKKQPFATPSGILTTTPQASISPTLSLSPTETATPSPLATETPTPTL